MLFLPRELQLMNEKQDKRVTISGLVTPAAWDEKGNVMGIAISSFNEVEYAVDESEKGDELISFLRKKVEVTGEVKDEDGKKKIRIDAYTLKGLEPERKPRKQ
jgi:hypothetical protein